MTALAESQRCRGSLLELLAVELAPREGRWAAVARIATGCAIAVAISMAFQIPEPTYMAYIVFLISKDEKNATVTSALGAFVAATFAILLTLGLELIDTAEPALRLPLMAMATFAAMFTARTFALGPISYLSGFVIVLLQTLVDDVPSPEALTRVTLWAWVVIFVPIAVTVVVNLLFGQGAAAFMDRTVRKVLKELESSLANGDYRKYLPEWRARLLPLLETAQHATDKRPRPGRLTVLAIRTLLDALVILEALPDNLPDVLRAELANRLRACRIAIGSGVAPVMDESLAPPSPLVDAGVEQAPAVIALFSTLSLLSGAIGRPGSSPDQTKAHHPTRRPFVGDAFSNPMHWQFALKTTMAVMISYAIYTLLDWPGMRTAVVTCFFVALASLGETVHKLVLRLSGAIIGGLIAGLCIVLILPHLTDIGQLCLLIAAVSAGAAWVATSSELLSYAGLQIAFAFFLGVLQGYAPATDLTVLRDRIAGILLGNIVVTIVFSSFWPQSARSGVRAALAEALHAIGEVIRRPRNAEEARIRTVQALVRADHMRTLSLFELLMLPRHARASLNVPSVTNIERLAGAAFVVTADAISANAETGSTARLAEWAESAADDVSRGRAVPPSPAPTALSPATEMQPDARLNLRAIEQLESEVQHVASAVH
ncbi:MAG: FUSC family protein [Steroidobacteraceae bacterium]|jgi:multidrug resistance protein MdtO